MPRPLRVWFPGAWYHITARGNNREAIFFAARDCQRYMRLLKDVMSQYECRIHAYALMPNHVHLMVETGATHPIAKPMQALHGAYTVYINRKYKRVGHVFQGRYHSVLVTQDTYALELSRYIHLNPVRAHLVSDPADYPWSSYQDYIDPTRNNREWIVTDHILATLSPHVNGQRKSYRQFISEGVRPQAWKLAKNERGV